LKRIAAVGLALLFLTYLLGIQLVYWTELSFAKGESAGLISAGKTGKDCKTVFYFSPAQFNSLVWTEGKREFMLDEHRFDVMGIEYLEGGVKITCFNDEKESRLVNAFADFVGKFIASHASSKNSKNPTGIQKEYLPRGFSFGALPAVFTRICQGPEFFFTPLAFISDSWNPPKNLF
jgi:hypothetical protein